MNLQIRPWHVDLQREVDQKQTMHSPESQSPYMVVNELETDVVYILAVLGPQVLISNVLVTHHSIMVDSGCIKSD